jgi:hypothetical protein
MQTKFIKGDFQMQKNSAQLQMFPTNHLKDKKLICSQEDFLVRLFQLQEGDEDLKMPEALSFLKSQGFSKITLKMDNPYPVYYSKMLKVCLAMTIDEHLLQCTKFLPSLIIPLNVKWLILAGFSPKIEKEFLFLEDIMEAQVEEKYFLSEKTTSKFKTLNKNQIKKLKKLNVDSSVSGTLTEAFGRGGSSAEYLKMLKNNPNRV